MDNNIVNISQCTKINLEGFMYLNTKFRIIRGREEIPSVNVREDYVSSGEKKKKTNYIGKTCWVKQYQI